LGKSGYHHKNLKEEMIENSIRIMASEGYEKFSLRKVAKACGVSHTAPYRHFKNKDSLVAAILDQVNCKFDHILKEAVSKYPKDLESQLKEMAFLYVKFFVENPEYMKFLFFSDFNKKFPSDKDLVYHMSQPYKTLVETVKQYQAEKTGATGRDNADELILATWGLAHGIAVLVTQKYFLFDGDYLELARKIIWNGSFIK
jgi:AcrR family transcriptional regulator